jgi:hypothetical protein
MEAGLDSLLAVEFRERLVSRLSVRVPSTFLFDHPTIRALEQKLGAMVPAPLAARPKSAPPPGVPH